MAVKLKQKTTASTFTDLATLLTPSDVTITSNTASWGNAVIVGTVGGKNLKFTMPSNPNTNYYHTPDYSSGLKIATGSGVSSLYVPDATTSQKGVLVLSATNLNTMINQLATGTGVPEGNDYYIAQYAGGGTTTTTYHRRPVSKLAEYVRGSNTSALKVSTINAPTSAGGSTYGPGSNGQVLKTNGSTVYWGNAPSASDPTVEQTFAPFDTGNYFPLILGFDNDQNASFQDVTNKVYYSANNNLFAQPDTGELFATIFVENGVDLADKYLGISATAANSSKLNGQAASYYLNYNNLTNKPTIPATNVIPATTTANKILVSTTTNGTAKWSDWSSAGFLKTDANGVIRVDTTSYLPKLTYEWNKAISFGSSGYLLIGKFPMYDSNITIDIDSTTSTTYHATLVIATQNINTTRGGTFVANVYGDANNTVTDSFKIQYSSGSRNFNVYFAPQAWSKNLVHIRAVALQSAPNESEICTNVDSVPTTDLITVTNQLSTKYLGISSKASDADKLDGQDSSYYLNYNNLSNKPTIDNNNQKVKAGSVTFDANDTINFVGSGIVSVTGDATNDAITISASHQSIKTLKTDNTTAQSTSSSEAIAGSGTINLHKVAKTGTYSDLISKPTLGTAAAKNYTTSVTSGSSDLVTSGAVYTAIDNLPEPMVFKGTLGTNGTITSLPTAAASNEGYTYKVITAGTYASQSAKVGDVFVSNGSAWVIVPAGDDVEDTWRNIKVNDTELLGTAISTGAVNFKNGGNITVTGSGNNITLGVASGYSIPSTTNQNAWSAKYDKPSGGIPASDLAQSYATQVKVGSTAYNPSSGVISLPAYPTTLPANGGNSDTVDSYHAEQLLAYAKYKYHDIAAFCNLTTPVYEISADGSTGWTETTFNKDLFAAKEYFSFVVTSTSQKGARFTWKGGFSWSSLAYCIIGWTYQATPATVTLKFESSNDSGSTWADRGTITGITANAAPAFYNISSIGGDAWFRVTILQTSSTGAKAISTIKLLTARWGDQGLGSEFEKPYTADGNKNIAPWNNNAQNLGASSYQWNNFYAKTIYENGTALSSKYLGISSKAADSDKLDGQDSTYYLNYNNLTNKPTINNNNQTVKGNGTAFGANDAVDIVGGTNIAVTPDTTNKKITVGVSYPKVTYSSFATNGMQKFLQQTDYSKPFYAHLKFHVSTSTAGSAINQTFEITILSRSNQPHTFGYGTTRSTWSGNSGIYQIRAYCSKDDTSSYANYAGGVDLNINSTTARNIEIEVFELENCTILNAPTTSTYNSTYHNATTPNPCVNGIWGMDLNANASQSTVALGLKINGPALITSTSVGIGRYTLLGLDPQRGDGASITSTFNSTGTSHVVNTTTVFHFGTHICYNDSGTDYAASTSSSTVRLGANQVCTSRHSVDLRYSCNCGTTGFTKNKPLYLRVTPNFSTATFTIHSDGLTQTLANNGYYIYLGLIRDDNTYTLTLVEDQRMYFYNGTNLLEYGSASYKNYTTSVTQNSNDLVTSGAVYTAIANAITTALNTPV